MPIVLKKFSQDVDLENPNVSKNFLVFSKDGREIRISVPAETIGELTRAIYMQEAAPEAEEPQDSLHKEASEEAYFDDSQAPSELPEKDFFSEDTEYADDIEPMDSPALSEPEPQMEDEVPSL